jgi:UDP-GlcNAc:undecaprenyl-phosphate GlcNAc-1-phosphate transferase
MPSLTPFAVALLTVLGLTPLVRRLARKLGFVDRPAERKVHAEPVPLGGGVALVLGVLAGTLVAVGRGGSGTLEVPGSFLLASLVGLLLAAGVGLWDDRSPLAPFAKLTGQILAAAVLVLGSGRPEPAALGGFGIPIFIVGVVGLMNACNFLDNMDGILGGIGLICAAAFFVVASDESPLLTAVAAIAAATAGASAGFLAYNFFPARIFMGDAGSLAVGYLLAALALGLTPPSLPARPALGLLLVLGYPAFDLIFVTVTRIRDRRRVWIPGRDHSTHRLNRLLENPRLTALTVYTLTGMMAAIGVAVLNHPGRASDLVAALGLALLCGLAVRLARVPAA